MSYLKKFLLVCVTFMVIFSLSLFMLLNTGSKVSKADYPVIGSFSEALFLASLNRGSPPPGANQTGCRLTSLHPYPIVLLNGTFENQYDNWAGLAPTLANAGYCVYTFDYGKTWVPFFYQLASESTSISQISNFVKYVLLITGASKVDLIGHSQGGMMAEYYAKFYGRDKVNQVIAIAPDTHGTTLDGLSYLASDFNLNWLVWSLCQSCVQQEANSTWINSLNTGPVAVSGVKYSVIETEWDYVVTPAPSAAFINEPGVNNILVQNYCPYDVSDHVGLVYDPVVWQMTLDILAGYPLDQIVC